MASIACATAAASSVAATTAVFCGASSWGSRAVGASSSRSVVFRGLGMPVRSLRVRRMRREDEGVTDILQRRIQGLSVQASATEGVDLQVSEKAAGSDSQKDVFVGSVGGVKGPVRIRLVRFGRKKLPFYRIFVAHSRARRDGRHIELIGFYNPIAGIDGKKQIGIKADRVKYWLSVGAQPTDTVRGILYKAGIMQPPTPA
ncbi:hypothetical protein BDL97_06G041100 [Sphagnum fallax]|nr:hypothetical protein BDL97_06G041100 [Sphagnum fallax]